MLEFIELCISTNDGAFKAIFYFKSVKNNKILVLRGRELL